MAQAAPCPLPATNDYRAECIRWMTDFGPDLFVTFVFNRSISADRAQEQFERFHGHLDRKLVGRAFLRRPSQRSSYIATIEKPEANLHIHALFKMRPLQKLRFHLEARDIWAKLVDGGNLDIQPISCARGAASYITKDLRPDRSDRLLLPRHIGVAKTR